MKIPAAILLGLYSVSATGLQVLTPTILKRVIGAKSESGNFDSHLGNYGHISYGTNFIGNLYYPQNNREGCTQFVDSDFKRVVDKNDQEDGSSVMSSYPIVLLNHGTCTHVSKTMNAQNYGFKAAIIVDDSFDSDFEMLRQSQDQQHEEAKIGYQLTIPYFKIFTTEGNLLKNQLGENLQTMFNLPNLGQFSRDSQVNIQVDLSLSNPDNRVEYELWYSSVFDLSTDQIRDIGEYNQPFGTNVLFTPRLVNFECMNCPLSIRQSECVSNGLYCPYQPKDVNVNAQYEEIDIVKEGLFEKCLYNYIVSRDGENINYQDWFKYMISMREQIDLHTDSLDYTFKKTPKDILSSMGYSRSTISSIHDCVENSFEVPSDYTTANSILKEDKSWANLMRVSAYPSVTINNQTYTGDFDGHDISVALCASFLERPDVCVNQAFDVMKGQDTEYRGVNLGNPMTKLIVVGLFIIFANVMIVLVHKKFSQKSNSNEIQLEVNQAVAQYFALRGEESKEDKKEYM